MRCKAAVPCTPAAHSRQVKEAIYGVNVKAAVQSSKHNFCINKERGLN
jgi:hypothetical protein